jgi:hypothetical protein
VPISRDDAEEFTQSLGQITAGAWRQIALAKRLGVPDALGLTVVDWVEQKLGGYIKLSILERQQAAIELKKEGHSGRQSAAILGVDESTIRADLANAGNPASGGVTINEIKDVIDADAENPALHNKGAITRTAHEEIAKFAFNQQAKDVPEGDPIRLGDFYELSTELKDNSVDLVFTDPPYDDDSLPLYEQMGEVAARILKPGGSLITYCGHMQLLDAGVSLRNHLRFWQPLCCLHPDGPLARLTEFGVIAQFKPMLWFVKGTRSDKHTFVNNVVAGPQEKDHHEWQQSESDAAYYIEKLSPEGGFVVDFFAGGGTTIVAAHRLRRFAIGYEKSAKHHAAACKRIAA